ncbi:MAG: GIY-YIG nuclease family protein [Candidatus Parcubacteria bacterium]|nr:GIY-YIG nuclease family protein [Candidatus Parcubacteria bacterium]
MNYTVYILQSLKNGRYYIGHTNDIKYRLWKHNTGKVKSTKPYLPWKIIYTEAYKTKSEAYRRELEIKQYKGGILFKRLLGQFNKTMRLKKKTNQLLKF